MHGDGEARDTHDGEGCFGGPDGRSRSWCFRDGWGACGDLRGCGVGGYSLAGGYDDGGCVFEEGGLLRRAVLSRVRYGGWVGMGR